MSAQSRRFLSVGVAAAFVLAAGGLIALSLALDPGRGGTRIVEAVVGVGMLVYFLYAAAKDWRRIHSPLRRVWVVILVAAALLNLVRIILMVPGSPWESLTGGIATAAAFLALLGLLRGRPEPGAA